ncbi:hypothetical protein GGX14DRAFT_383739 [Mycena pura]|uniref:Uncharacterized protein n=1 Tax=Mycena pura TaxID=153505 RepID=A0AAD7E561_9AGAR|nr:hypothetical protein GGX14DRAFT_383739 [Mycena pura]
MTLVQLYSSGMTGLVAPPVGHLRNAPDGFTFFDALADNKSLTKDKKLDGHQHYIIVVALRKQPRPQYHPSYSVEMLNPPHTQSVPTDCRGASGYQVCSHLIRNNYKPIYKRKADQNASPWVAGETGAGAEAGGTAVGAAQKYTGTAAPLNGPPWGFITTPVLPGKLPALRDPRLLQQGKTITFLVIGERQEMDPDYLGTSRLSGIGPEILSRRVLAWYIFILRVLLFLFCRDPPAYLRAPTIHCLDHVRNRIAVVVAVGIKGVGITVLGSDLMAGGKAPPGPGLGPIAEPGRKGGSPDTVKNMCLKQLCVGLRKFKIYKGRKHLSGLCSIMMRELLPSREIAAIPDSAACAE